MKNIPTDAEDRLQPSAPWREALALFDSDLRRRGMAEKTRRAYGVDLGQFALWCTAQDVGPRDVGSRELRRYAAVLSGRDAVAATIARKLAALRAFYRTLREHGQVSQNPVDLIPSPKRPRSLPAVLRPDELATLLDRIPASTPLELRDRALLEVAYACGLRAEELVNLDVTSVGFDAEELRVEGKGSKTRIGPPASRRCAPSRAIWSAPGRRSRPVTATRRSSSRSPAGGCRPPTCAGACGCGRGTPRCRAASPRTPCATRSPRTCSRAARTCARSRSCWVTPPSPRRRSTLE